MGNPIAVDHRSFYRLGVEYIITSGYIKSNHLVPPFAQLALDYRTNAPSITR
tara:strand:+ start:747 stop:902 length:156 start_codon:yes stop_codon:yes gene_type:complete